jgi:polyisoprenoid-binding protein YceI
MKKLAFVLVVALLVSFGASAQTVSFDVEKSELKWTGKKVAGEHYGKVKLKEGSIEVKNNEIGKGKFVIDMASITVDDIPAGETNGKLVGHLKSDDFFGVEKYSDAVLDIVGSKPFKNGKAVVSGRLTIKGKTHPVSFEATQNGKNYTAVVSVDRTLYDIKYGSGKFFQGLGDNMIRDEFTLEVKLVAK